MELEEIMAKLKEKEIDSTLISAIKALDNSSEIERLKGELESEQGKSAGILDDKKKYKERAEKAEKKLLDIEKEKLPADERHKQELEELRTQLESEKADREKDKAEFAKAQREARLADITGSVNWSSDTPHDTAKLIISNALNDVDLSDSNKVNEVLTAVKETHKPFLAAAAPGGSGGRKADGITDNYTTSTKPLTTADVVMQAMNTK